MIRDKVIKYVLQRVLSDAQKFMRHYFLSAAIWCLSIIFMTPKKQLWNLQSGVKVTLLMACG